MIDDLLEQLKRARTEEEIRGLIDAKKSVAGDANSSDFATIAAARLQQIGQEEEARKAALAADRVRLINEESAKGTYTFGGVNPNLKATKQADGTISISGKGTPATPALVPEKSDFEANLSLDNIQRQLDTARKTTDTNVRQNAALTLSSSAAESLTKLRNSIQVDAEKAEGVMAYDAEIAKSKQADIFYFRSKGMPVMESETTTQLIKQKEAALQRANARTEQAFNSNIVANGFRAAIKTSENLLNNLYGQSVSADEQTRQLADTIPAEVKAKATAIGLVSKEEDFGLALKQNKIPKTLLDKLYMGPDQLKQMAVRDADQEAARVLVDGANEYDKPIIAKDLIGLKAIMGNEAAIMEAGRRTYPNFDAKNPVFKAIKDSFNPLSTNNKEQNAQANDLKYQLATKAYQISKEAEFSNSAGGWAIADDGSYAAAVKKVREMQLPTTIENVYKEYAGVNANADKAVIAAKSKMFASLVVAMGEKTNATGLIPIDYDLIAASLPLYTVRQGVMPSALDSFSANVEKGLSSGIQNTVLNAVTPAALEAAKAVYSNLFSRQVVQPDRQITTAVESARR